LVPIRKQSGLKAGAFSPALLVPVAITETNGRYKPGPMAFFPPVLAFDHLSKLLFRALNSDLLSVVYINFCSHNCMGETR
jgi:hypothetical protein